MIMERKEKERILSFFPSLLLRSPTRDHRCDDFLAWKKDIMDDGWMHDSKKINDDYLFFPLFLWVSSVSKE